MNEELIVASFIGVILTILMFVMYVCLCACCIQYAGKLRRSQFFWALVSIFFTPLVAAIMLHCLGPIETSQFVRQEDDTFKLTLAEKAHILNRRANGED